MKLAEKAFVDGDNLIVQKTHDLEPAMQRAEAIRQRNGGVLGEKRLVGSIPFELIEIWAQEAGVSISDTEAVREILHKKILSGEFNKFRVWGGTY